jgi:Lrp/AsnC family leucine-responsive transcriptional regulator
MTQLARAVSMSPPAVTDRVRRMERTGVIRGYQLDIDPAALGLAVCAYVRVKPLANQVAKVAEVAAACANVAECHRITGEDCFLMRVHVAAVDDLPLVLDPFRVLGQTVTSIVVATPVPRRSPPIEAQG